MEWQSIDSAPKDGSYFLVFGRLAGWPTHPMEIMICRWHVWCDGSVGWEDQHFKGLCFTYWMPLPKPPVDTD